jgi:hypothetical protein
MLRINLAIAWSRLPDGWETTRGEAENIDLIASASCIVLPCHIDLLVADVNLHDLCAETLDLNE